MRKCYNPDNGDFKNTDKCSYTKKCQWKQNKYKLINLLKRMYYLLF